MNPNMLCSKCKKRMAVVFVTRMEGDKPINEGLCIKCAKEMNIKPVTDLLDKMGITDEQLDAMDDQMAGLIDSFGDSFDMGGAQSMPFMQMFNMPAQQEEPEDESELDGDYAGGELESYEQEEADGVQQEDRRSSKEKRQQEKERKENAAEEEAAVDEFLMPGEDDTSEEKPHSGELLKAASTQGGLTYMNSGAKAEENRSSAWVLLIVGALGILVMALGITGVLPFNIGNPYMFYGVMSAVFILFIVMGVVSMRNAKLFEKKAESENSLVDTLLKWSEENLTAEKIDAQIENAADTPEEALYYKRFEVIRSQMNHQFMNLDQQMLENLIDTKIYEQIFPDTDGAAEE